MNIVERGRAFLQGLGALAERQVWAWRRCPRCGEMETCKWGSYERRPWFLSGRQTVRVQRHRCHGCGRTYSEGSVLLVRGGWYAREVRRSAIDHWQHLGVSTRRTAEVLRSWLGQQERWQHRRPLDPVPADALACHLSASTVERWLDHAGQTATVGLREQLVGATSSGQMATDGLWARLGGGTKRVMLAPVDNVTGVIWPPVVVAGESTAAAWATLFQRAEQAGLVLRELRGIASDGATGLEGHRRQAMPWVSHQRCVFHLWRGLSGAFAAAVDATELTGAAARRAAKQTRRTLTELVRGVYDAATDAEARAALARLAAHALGAPLAPLVAVHLEAARYYHCGYNQGLGRASPEWLWRDFRLRSSHGRNHGSDQRLERAALLWAIYHNFEPAQDRSERQRTYRHPGQAPLTLAGLSPGNVTYLDALAV